LKISEIFESLQGEGKYAGYPMLFIRTSGCTRACSYCDTKYHTQGKDMTVKELVDIIKKSKVKIVCWTGGEPLLQRKEILEVMNNFKVSSCTFWHLETNGDLLEWQDTNEFDYIACSPKDLKTAKKIKKIFSDNSRGSYDIKVVTDLEKEGMDMLKGATVLMPLSTYTTKDREINKKVWEYCTNNNLRFSPRLQTLIFGKKKGI
jgi:7-carboxy-7-deazaguanine synthase